MTKKTEIFGFALYDFASSAYLLVFTSFLFPIYFIEIIFSNHNNGDFFWGLSLALSVIVAVLLGPLIGSLADKGSRKKVLTVFTALVSLAMFGIVFLPPSYKILNMIFFIILNCLFVISLTIYDSFLPRLVDTTKRTAVSGFAWGFGYLGGIVALLIIFAMQGGTLKASKLAFLITALFFTLFSSISIYLLPAQHSLKKCSRKSFKTPFRLAFTTWFFLLLASIWLINDTIDGLIHFVGLYGRITLQISTKDIGIVFIIIQLIAFPATWLMSVWAQKKGLRLIIGLSLIIWGLLIVGLLFSPGKLGLLLFAIPAGLVIGTTQALLRAYYANQIPKQSAGFYFGFYSFATRASSIFAPFMFGLISSVTKNQKFGMISLLITLILGSLLFFYYKKPSASPELTVT